MFGIIWTTIATVCHLKSSLNEKIENSKNKTRYLNENNLTYIDSKGRTRLLKNNEICVCTREGIVYVDKRGRVLIDYKTGRERML